MTVQYSVGHSVNCIEEHIRQLGLQLYVSIEQLLLDAANGHVSVEQLSTVCVISSSMILIENFYAVNI